MSITYNGKLDMTPGRIPIVFHASQYDSDFTLHFELYSSSGDLYHTSNMTAEVRGTNTDGSTYSHSVSLYYAESTDTMTVSVSGDEAMTIAPGRNVYEICLKDGSHELGSANFILDVEPAAMKRVYLTYMSYDGRQVLKVVRCIDGVPQGSAPAIPSRQSSAQYDYTAVGWSKKRNSETADTDAQVDVYEDRMIYAAYSKSEHLYTVRFMKGITVLYEAEVPYGGDATYSGTEPTEQDKYFDGWVPEPVNVQSDMDCQAQFTAYVYLIYKTYDGSETIQETMCAHGVPLQEAPTIPYREGTAAYRYVGVGWAEDDSEGVPDPDYDKDVYADRVVFAVYEQLPQLYEIEYRRSTTDGGGEIATYYAPYMSWPVYPTDSNPPVSSRFGYRFSHWSPALSVVDRSQTYTAVFRNDGNAIIQDSWETILTKIANGRANYSDGSIKPIVLEGIGVVNMQIVGARSDNRSSELADGSGYATYDWMCLDAISISAFKDDDQFGPTAAWDSTSLHKTWPECDLRAFCRSTVKQSIPALIRDAIKDVKKTCREVDGDDYTVIDDIWIPSYRELYFTSPGLAERSGPQYLIFDATVGARIKSYGGNDVSYWVRTHSDSGACRVTAQGGYNSTDVIGDNSYIVFGFSL